MDFTVRPCVCFIRQMQGYKTNPVSRCFNTKENQRDRISLFGFRLLLFHGRALIFC